MNKKYEGLEAAIRGELEHAMMVIQAVLDTVGQGEHIKLLATIQGVGMQLTVDSIGAMQVMHGNAPEAQVREVVAELVKAYGYVVVSLELEPDDG